MHKTITRAVFGFGAAAGLLCTTVAWAAIVIGQSTTNTSTIISYTQLSLALPGAVEAGDLLLANVSYNGGASASLTAPAGWALIAKTSNGKEVTIASYYKIAGVSEPAAYSWSLDAATKASGGITRFSGVDAANPIDASLGATGNGKVAAAPSVNASGAGEEVITIYTTPWGLPRFNHFNAAPGMTEQYEVANVPLGATTALDAAVQALAGATGQKAATINTPLKLPWAAQTIVLHQVAATTLGNGLVSYWNLNGINGKIADSVGQNELVNNNNATFVTGKVGNGIKLVSSSSQSLSISDASQAGLDLSSGFSACGWVKLNSLPQVESQGYYLLSKWQDGVGANDSYELTLINEAGDNKVRTSFSDGNQFDNLSYSWSPVIGNWYLICSTWDSSTRKVATFVNGVEIGSNQSTASMQINDSSTQFLIGANTDINNSPYNFMDGIVDEVGIWNRALTPAEVTALYNNGNGRQYPF